MTQHDNEVTTKQERKQMLSDLRLWKKVERALRNAPEPVPYTDLQPSLDRLITLTIEYRIWYHGPRKQALKKVTS